MHRLEGRPENAYRARGGQLHKELHGPPDRGRRRGRSRGVRSGHQRRNRSGERQPGSARSRLRHQHRARPIPVTAYSRRTLQLPWLWRVQQLPRVSPPGRGRNVPLCRVTSASATVNSNSENCLERSSVSSPIEDGVQAASDRIVFTGIGAVCGSGLTVQTIWDAVRTGCSSVGPINQWDATRWPIRVAAEVIGVENRTLVEDRKLHKIIARTDLFGLYAAGAAIEQSGLLAHRGSLDEASATRFSDRSGVFAGSGGGAYRSNYDFFPLMTTAGGDLQTFGRELNSTVNPMWLLRHLPNNVLCHVGIRYGFKGTNACITNQCVGGATAVAEAAEAIRAGEADRAVAVGHDTPIEPETILHYHRLGLLGNDAVRPFDRERSGTIFGEGASALVLERATDAATRRAAILGEFLGAGCTTEGTGI